MIERVEFVHTRVYVKYIHILFTYLHTNIQLQADTFASSQFAGRLFEKKKCKVNQVNLSKELALFSNTQEGELHSGRCFVFAPT